MRENNPQPTLDLRIHGDNILECESALLLLTHSLRGTVHLVPSMPFLPWYEIRCEGRLLCRISLFPGYGRWDVNLQDVLQSHGVPLREAADAIVTRVSPDGEEEEILVALEFCNALPAGNNAWQRSGRALAYALIGVPYLYYAQAGGVELGRDRIVKAPRFPNPIVPFSYLAASKMFNVVCLPVYEPSPSSSHAVRQHFQSVFGTAEGQWLIRCILQNSSTDEPVAALTRKALDLIRMLSAQRQRVDTLRGNQWEELLRLETAPQKAKWLDQRENRMTWEKKTARKVRVTETFRGLLELFRRSGPAQLCISVGAQTIPLCLVAQHTRDDLAESLSSLYGGMISSKFIKWVGSPHSPLVVVWICGFKPRGEDSRPDRGLVPMARMLFGDEVDILSVVYGPGRPKMWAAFQDSPQRLAEQNGLWQSIVKLSDAVLVDSDTADNGPMARLFERAGRRRRGHIRFPSISPTPVFSEQDVDSTLHTLFSHQEHLGVFEGMCNPPGGDWSGFSIRNFETGEEFRWTSLPRVSETGGKRPDHVVQLSLDEGTPGSVGNRVKTYLVEAWSQRGRLSEDVCARLDHLASHY